MKQAKSKSSFKLLKDALEQDIIIKLKEATAALGNNSKKLDKKIEREAAQLAKKLAKAIKPVKNSENETKKPAVADGQKAKPAKVKETIKNGTPLPDNTPGQKAAAEKTGKKSKK